jgi:tRNA G18 (ribose-2'-O)-methylase SpoU
MMDTCESLNAGVAASIIMYEVYHEWNDLYRKNC